MPIKQEYDICKSCGVHNTGYCDPEHCKMIKEKGDEKNGRYANHVYANKPTKAV